MTAVRKLRAGSEILAGGVPGAFLGVTQSARGYRWTEMLEPQRVNDAVAISQQHGLPELLGRVLAARGVALDDVSVFLDPTIRALMPDPSTLTDMDKAARRLADAVMRREPVAIFGDYDVDGACSSALLKRFLHHHDVPARIYIPDRLTEGYGPNAAALDQLISEGAKLIVTVDCGTTSVDVLAGPGRRNIDVVVIDHHQADEVLPAVHALVNPNRRDDISGQGHLCAAGVVFLTLVATVRELRQRGYYGATREPQLIGDLDLVALATVADVVPLKGLNRAYVTKGLAVMRQRENVGLRALADAAGLSEAPTVYHLGFILGPRINAGGRIGDAGLGAKLLSTDDEAEATRIAVLLDRLNKERKEIEQAALEEAVAMAERMLEEAPGLAVMTVGSPDWHRGVVGLIASRLTERFKRPSCVIAWDKEAASGGVISGTGSLRSVAGIDIGSVVRDAVAAGHLIKGGGHAMAAGLTVDRGKLDVLTTYFAEALKSASARLAERAGLAIDGALTPSGANDALIELLERAGPYGQGNPQPRFAFPAHRVKFAKPVGTAHLRCVLEAGDGSRLDAVAFRAVGQPLGELLMAASGGFPVHVAGQLRRDTWGGRNRIELQIEDAADPRTQ